ncbi:MAG: KEOPS complex subunit Pcc1 [Candidatus Bathyarchaeota archaeon]|nr:KEOPS complex subunit Pcc1 [Candidatus Bathyarchaeota archaeon]
MKKTTIKLEYDDPQTAAAVAGAVSPDNFKTPAGLTVKTEQNGAVVTTNIVLDGKLSTLIATIDDLLESASTAEKTLQVMKKEK